MNQIEQQVRRARRRLALGVFAKSLCMTLFIAMFVATIACAVPAFYPLALDVQQWNLAWIAGSVTVALIASIVHAVVATPSSQQVALEIDKRFELNERLSSSLSMSSRDRESDFGMMVNT